MADDHQELEHRSPRTVEPQKTPLDKQLPPSVPILREIKDHPSAGPRPANSRLQIAKQVSVVAASNLESGVGDHNGYRNFVFAYARPVPARVCAVVPDGLREFKRVLIFFHPLPTPRAGYSDSQYAEQTGGWNNIYRYLDQQGAQLAASKKKIVMIFPIFSLASANTCGVFPEKWRDLIELILRRIRDDRFPGEKGKDVDITDVITASYSAGIQYMSTFLSKAVDLKSNLREVWDYDGRFSTSRDKSEGLGSFAPTVMTYDQQPVRLKNVVTEFRSGKGIHIPLARWEDLPNHRSSFLDVPDPNVEAVKGASLFVHGAMPRYLMFHSLMESKVG
jgi:hypothetical protein